MHFVARSGSWSAVLVVAQLAASGAGPTLAEPPALPPPQEHLTANEDNEKVTGCALACCACGTARCALGAQPLVSPSCIATVAVPLPSGLPP